MFSPVLILSVVVFVVSAKSIEDVVSREEAETERIIAGRTATRGQFPWAVALYFNNQGTYQFICTGSIISPTTVMTAAHCVVFNGVTQEAESYYAVANVSKSAESVLIQFASVTPHPQYSGSNIDNDVAIFKTTEPIPFSNEVDVTCIARPDTPMYEYRRFKATVMGWGNTSPINGTVIIPDKLQYTDQYIVRNSLCSWVNGGVNDDKLCATGFVMGVCNGDSGGPLVILSKNRQDRRPVQIGITSYINAMAGCGKIVPAVYTRVSSFYDFIMQTANDGSICVK